MKAILHSHDILFPFARANHLVRLLRGEEVSRNLFAKTNRAQALHTQWLAEITIEHRLLADDTRRRTLCDDFAVMKDDDGSRQRHDRAHDMLDQY